MIVNLIEKVYGFLWGDLVWGKKLNVANMLPSVVLAVLAAYVPWGF